uniref:Rap guanine nucleotide exchange factor (GEF) 3 n=1 Tax=Gadus morhua TaxID=8049 RepID=A0A8C5FS80_GADMO
FLSPSFVSDRILKAARVVYNSLIERNPALIRDRKHHLKTYRQCCSGKELVDWLLKLNEGGQSRSQAVGMWQVLVDEGILVHVKQELNYHDKDTQFYRFLESEDSGRDSEDELQEGLSLLSQMGPDALLTMILRKHPSQRSAEDLEVIYEELLHVKAVAHLSTSVRKELAAVLVFETHGKAGTVLFSQGDKGNSWYIIWKGSVNVITHGKGLVAKLREGEDFGQLALLNDAPRAATIILREDNCHFLRVDKQDYIRILKDVEANTVRLEEHGHTVLVLEKSTTDSTDQGGAGGSSKYTVMSGTPEKILEHLLEKVKLDTNGNDTIDSCVGDFLLTHKIFMASSQLCPALQHQYPLMFTGSELEKADYSLAARQKVVKLLGQWVLLYGRLLKDDPVALDFLEVRPPPLPGQTHPMGQWPEQDQERVMGERGGGDAVGYRAQLKLDSSAVSVGLGLNERLFMCTSSQVERLRPLKEQQGPEQGTADALEQMCSKDVASQLTHYDWELFTAMHEVELIYYVFGRSKFPGATTANLQRFVRRFNEVQYWVATEVCLCQDLMKRAALLKKFVKIASRIPSKTKRIYCAYERLMDPSRNHRAYRLAVAKLSPPYIPFMPLLLKDMTFIHEGNKNYKDKLVNFEKMVSQTKLFVHHKCGSCTKLINFNVKALVSFASDIKCISIFCSG